MSLWCHPTDQPRQTGTIKKEQEWAPLGLLTRKQTSVLVNSDVQISPDPKSPIPTTSPIRTVPCTEKTMHEGLWQHRHPTSPEGLVSGSQGVCMADTDNQVGNRPISKAHLWSWKAGSVDEVLAVQVWGPEFESPGHTWSQRCCTHLESSVLKARWEAEAREFLKAHGSASLVFTEVSKQWPFPNKVEGEDWHLRLTSDLYTYMPCMCPHSQLNISTLHAYTHQVCDLLKPQIHNMCFLREGVCLKEKITFTEDKQRSRYTHYVTYVGLWLPHRDRCFNHAKGCVWGHLSSGPWITSGDPYPHLSPNMQSNQTLCSHSSPSITYLILLSNSTLPSLFTAEEVLKRQSWHLFNG